MQVLSGWKWDLIESEALWNENIEIVGLCLAVNRKEGFTDIKNKARNYIDDYQGPLKYAHSRRFHEVLPSHPT